MVAPASRADQVRSFASLGDSSHACTFDYWRCADSNENGRIREEEDSVVEFGDLEGELVLLAHLSIDNHSWAFSSIADEGDLLSILWEFDARMFVTWIK